MQHLGGRFHARGVADDRSAVERVKLILGLPSHELHGQWTMRTVVALPRVYVITSEDLHGRLPNTTLHVNIRLG